VSRKGTGFFILPGYILTCAHVITEAVVDNNPLDVYWPGSQNTYRGHIIARQDDRDIDLAIIWIERADGRFPIVYLNGEIGINDDLYGFGYTTGYGKTDDEINGVPVTFRYEGSYGDTHSLLKFKLGNAKGGMSGGPLLNERTGYVCGIMSFTVAPETLLGGGGIPVQTIASFFPEWFYKNQQYHLYDRRWLERREASIPLPEVEFKLRKGKEALWHREYDVAIQELNAVRRLISEQEQPKKASQVLYYLALALLNGMPPYTQGVSTIDAVIHLLEAAIDMYAAYSYLLALARIKEDLFKWNGFTYRLREVEVLQYRMRTTAQTAEDNENLNFLRHCQPSLLGSSVPR
jgi:hypothetical protein